jgi:hypothetical protein
MRWTGPMKVYVTPADEVRGTRMLARVCELLALDARRDQLDVEELAHWLDLDDSLRGAVDDPRVAPRVPIGLPARLQASSDDDDASAWIADVSGSGAYVETRLPVEVGARVVLRVGPGISGYEWRMPAEVVRIERERGRGVGMRWCGAPLVLRHHGARASASGER